MRTDELFWDVSNGEEIFQFLATMWDINQVKQLIIDDPREVKSVSVPELRNFASLVRTDKDRAAEADLNHPIIVARFNQGYIPIDGYHRIRRALDEGLDSLPAVFLTAQESKESMFG